MRFIIVGLVGMVLIPGAWAASCADGYSLGANGVCQTQCAPGYYVAVAGEPCKKITGDIPLYTDTAHTVNWGETSGANVKTCPPVHPDTPHTPGQPLYIPTGYNHDNITQCIYLGIYQRYSYNPNRQSCYGAAACLPQMATHGVVENPCYYEKSVDGYGLYTNESKEGCVGSSRILTCDAGYWAPSRYSPTSGRMLACQPVGMDYWSPDGDLDRYPCAAGTITCGWGDCAAAATDCRPYVSLVTDTDTRIKLRSTRDTQPALRLVMPDGQSYWGQMAADAFSNAIGVGVNNETWHVVNPLDQFEKIPANTIIYPGLDSLYIIP